MILALYILNKIFKEKSIWLEFLKKLDCLLTYYKDDIDLKLIGFPENYKKQLENE